MRIETINGRQLLCGAILEEEFILPGQKWARADGTDGEAYVVRIKDGQVAYAWDYPDGSSVYAHKSVFDFQTRYCLVLGRGHETITLKGTNQCASSQRYATLQH